MRVPVRRLGPMRMSVVRRGGSVRVPVVPRVGVSVVAVTIVGMPVRRMVVRVSMVMTRDFEIRFTSF